MNLIDKIYRPFIFARYSLFLKSNKNVKSIFPIDEEYGMLSFFNISTPLWSEVAIVLLLSNIITISYNERLFLIGLLLGLNYAISRIIIRRLKKEIMSIELLQNLIYQIIQNTIVSCSVYFCYLRILLLQSPLLCYISAYNEESLFITVLHKKHPKS